ncbi:MAG TPA: twin-arginine translocation signal domain-containing protein [Sedimentisphaerales bacterium]|nr:twin-arginine translocation signal domain-containing protein [Sedimentisphaerales bacterium]
MNRRQFMKNSGFGAVALGLASCNAPQALSDRPTKKSPQWSIQRKKWKSLGPMDLTLQLDEGQQWANQSLIKYGTVEPPNGGIRSMRSACMPAESCAHYYAMTGDAVTLEALKAAVRTFRKYRVKAKGHRIPYDEVAEPLKIDVKGRTEEKPTIEYETISCHVGRNMRGMRAAAHVLGDEKLLHEVAEELNWWIDNPLAFNREKHFFDARIFVDENGKTIGSERKYTMNMGGSLACAMWLVGNDLGDRRLMDYGEDQIINGIAPHQQPNGYFPYNIGHKVEFVDDIALDSNYYHALTLQVISSLLAYSEWRDKPKYVEMMRRGARYIREKLTRETGVVKHPPHIDVIRAKKLGFSQKAPFGITADSALVHTRIYKYLGDEEAFEQAAKNLRWMHWNSPSCIPFLATDAGFGWDHIVTEWGFSHSFRQIMLAAWEGMHLRQKGIRDVEAVFMA